MYTCPSNGKIVLKMYFPLSDQININKDLQAWVELEVAVEVVVAAAAAVVVLVNPNPARVKWYD
jgi:hypothetical protein